jgi:hypothetical protein
MTQAQDEMWVGSRVLSTVSESVWITKRLLHERAW